MKFINILFKWGVIVLVIAIVLGFGIWWLSGGRWYIMTTASMSPHLPVGTLVFTRPLIGLPKIGNIYAFTPPAQSTIFMHQIVSGNSTTGFHTKGFLNSSIDPWVITKANIQAVAVGWFPDLGWLLFSLPIWLGIALLGWLAVKGFGKKWGHWVVGISIALAISIPVLIWHFLVNGQVVTAVAHRGIINMYLVSTGVLPASVSVGGHNLGILLPGSAKAFSIAVPNTHHMVLFNLHASLPWWGWLLLILVCLIPLIHSAWLVLDDIHKQRNIRQLIV